MILRLLHLPRLPYAEGLAIQARVVAARQAGLIADTLLLLEHPPVLTLGRNARRDNILLSPEALSMRGIEVHEINRGGDVTYHGPGQLVGYPIVDLRGDLARRRSAGSLASGCVRPDAGPHLGPVDFMRLLEEVLIRACAHCGVLTTRVPGRTGVWTTSHSSATPQTEKKVAALGIHVSRGITSHGFALNVTTDLRDFQWIVPCGIADRSVTSLELESTQTPPPTLASAANAVTHAFAQVFSCQIVAAASLDDLLTPEVPSQPAAQ